MTDKEKLDIALKALNFADTILFDTYSNAQKLSWQQIEENCRSGCRVTKAALESLDWKIESLENAT